MHTVRQRRRRLTYLVAGLAVAMAAIIAACAAVIVWILHISAASLDSTKQEDERRLLRVLIQTQQTTLAKALEDYTNWKELYDDVEGPHRSKWERDNLGPYLASTFGVDHVFVASRTGEIVYAFSNERHYRPTVADRNTVIRLAQLAFRIEPRDVQRATAGAVPMHRGAALAATTTIRATTFHVPSHFALITLVDLSAAHLGRLGHSYGIAGLHTEPGAKVGGALRDPDGKRPPFHLVWRPADEGQALFRSVLPMVLTASAAALIAFVGLLLTWWRIAEDMRRNEERMIDAEIAASDARAQAAEETSRSKSMFIANMSHELRTPLNAIIGFSELMVSDVLGPIAPRRYRDYVDDIHASGKHLLGIVEDVLHVSRIEAGKIEVEPQRVPVREAIGDSVRIVEVLAHKRDIALAVSIFADVGDVLADRKALQQILINVLSNAVKFSPDGGLVEIRAGIRGSACEVSIHDHGCGIPPETLKDLGKPFVQAEHAYSRTYQGTGLGLAICFKLADAMGASISVESALQKGTTVRIRLKEAEPRSSIAKRATVAA